ncbi:uncharacterized protein VDAG_00836 [Verticillium dahliae VdLs.17]|uniref:DSBA-like thioredoxin domain-containing protein n=1 Tax=Verticillium dahliae (strain VdLs.17 / ATCC MYA-4575 / FGSC 10137) TaxID=498257 RepID=G2WSQ5_VERDV|nr:uncharacterized protein VDAG_00836 [Verticillium dahliae VdLs.17]EGY17154.1 hypothetical protein VDAG_00836 [Verticillium dahliae VdLs.17]
MTNFNIKIISDNVCPWPPVLRRQEPPRQGHRALPKDGPRRQGRHLHCHLVPLLPGPDVAQAGRAAARAHGPALSAPAASTPCRRASPRSAPGEGIRFSFDSRIGNTRDSHRVVALAQAKGPETQNRVVAEIMRSYFEEDGDITSKDMLVQAAVKGGLEAGEVRAWLESDGGGAQVDREVQEAYALGVSGVPHFVVDGQQLGGAQDVEAFVEVFANIKEKRA